MKEEAKGQGQEQEQATIKGCLPALIKVSRMSLKKEQESENKIKFLLKEIEETRKTGLPGNRMRLRFACQNGKDGR